MKKIKLLLADDNKNTRESIRRLIELDHSIDVAAEASNGQEVLEKIKSIEPEIVLIDEDLPVINGIDTTRSISLNYPKIMVIMISMKDDMSSIKEAMLAGAKEYLVKPLVPAELNSTIKKVAEFNRRRIEVQKPKTDSIVREKSLKIMDNKLVCVYGTKGGVGKSVICTNLAVAMGNRYKNKVSVVDLDLQFGDISLMMDLNPRKTISELMQEGDDIGMELLEEYLYERNGVSILAPPNKPELAELVTTEGVGRILALLRDNFYYTFIDTPSFIDETSLTALEISDMILLVISLDLPTIKNVKKGIDVLRSLRLLHKTKLILNRSSGIAGIEAADVEMILNMKIQAEIPSDGKLVVSSVNKGMPFIKTHPRASISRGVMDIINLVEKKQQSRSSIIR